MGRPSLKNQVVQAFKRMLAIGCSKHADKEQHNSHKEKIYSFGTLHTYQQQSILFCKYCKDHHGCATLEQCREYANEYVSQDKFAASTKSTKAAALCKLYQCEKEELGITYLPPRKRSEITRCRTAPDPAEWNEKNFPQLVNFLKATGLRRHELLMLHKGDLEQNEGMWFIHVRRGKGGKPRLAPVLDPEFVRAFMRGEPSELVFPEGISKHCPVHYYRAIYATTLYELLERPFEVCKATPFLNPEHWDPVQKRHYKAYDCDSVYWLRGDRKGEWLDKSAMLQVSKALGHNRISVAGAHYIRNTIAEEK